MELIRTFMSYNDKLGAMLTNALRVYDLEVFPAPSFVLFYNVDLLISKYANVLLEDMVVKVDNVFNVSQLYNYNYLLQL